MEVKFPVTLDNGIIIYGDEEPFEFENEQKFNGYDADGNRITNIAGFDGQYLLKWCPHCKQILPSIDFGPEGRPASDPKMRRDQSWCLVCRARE